MTLPACLTTQALTQTHGSPIILDTLRTTSKVRYEWSATVAGFTFCGKSDAICASDVLHEAAKELAAQELFDVDDEVWAELSINVKWAGK